MKSFDVNKRVYELLNKGDSLTDKLYKSYEKKLIKQYKLALVEIKKEIAKLYEKYGDKVNYADLVAYNRLTNLEKTIADNIKKLTNQNIRTTESSIKNIFSFNYYYAGFATENSLGIKLAFGKLREETINASLYNPLDRIKWSDRMKQNAQTYVNQIKTEITQGLIQGKGYAKIAQTLNEKTNINANKLIRIVRTEGHRVQSAGRISGFDKSEASAKRLGIEVSRIWISTLDTRTRDSHRKMDGQKAKLVNGKWQWTLPSGARTEGPGMSGIAEEDINCRCTTAITFNNIPPKFRRDNLGKNVIEYKTYEEWYKEKFG